MIFLSESLRIGYAARLDINYEADRNKINDILGSLDEISLTIVGNETKFNGGKHP